MKNIKLVAGPVTVRARLVIELYTDGRVNVNAPEDRLIAYGMLGIANEILTAISLDKTTKSSIVTPTIVPPKM